MSYDLYMFARDPGLDPGEQLERLAEEDESAPAPEIEARNRRLAEAIVATDSRLETAPAGDQVYRDDVGLTVDLFAEQAAISFPYWESQEFDALMADVRRIAATITAETGWALYDPQLDRYVDPDDDQDAMGETFDSGRDRLSEMLEAEQPADERPPQSLWKRLFGG